MAFEAGEVWKTRCTVRSTSCGGRGGFWGTLVMSCRDTIHLICMYLEGKLSPGVEGEIERHLLNCADCRLVLDAATTTLDRYFDQPKEVSDSQAA